MGCCQSKPSNDFTNEEDYIPQQNFVNNNNNSNQQSGKFRLKNWHIL